MRAFPFLFSFLLFSSLSGADDLDQHTLLPLAIKLWLVQTLQERTLGSQLNKTNMQTHTRTPHSTYNTLLPLLLTTIYIYTHTHIPITHTHLL